MAQRIISVPTYVTVLVVLVLLTVLTVAVSFFHVEGLWHIVIGLSIATVKASLVVLFFMHALHSPQATRAVIAITIFWLVAVFFALTFSDYFTRGLLPYLPGH